jgi:hypothetical protein
MRELHLPTELANHELLLAEQQAADWLSLERLVEQSIDGGRAQQGALCHFLGLSRSSQAQARCQTARRQQAGQIVL